MKKNKVFIVCGVLLTVIISSCLYVGIGNNHIENKMRDYLKENNYEETEIKSIDVKHSFMNILLSYNEWMVDVVFEDEPTSVYKYTVKEGSIVQSSVSGTTNKEDLKHLDVNKLIYGDMSVVNEIGITQNDKNIESNRIGFSELAPGQEEKYSTEYYIFTDDAWFDYDITYERAAMTVVIGLRAEDGKEYSKEIIGGDEKGTITGIPAGSYEVFVRSSVSNVDYEDTTIESLNVTGAMNFVAGQRLPEDMSYSHSSFTTEINDFGFSYKIIEGLFARGERVGFSIALTNQQSESYVWIGSESNYRANVRLICMDGDIESFICFPELIPDTDDMAKHEVGAGETRTFDYYFIIPDNAVAGEYSLVCSFGNSTETFHNVFTIE